MQHPAVASSQAHPWRTLRLFNIFRIILATTLFGLTLLPTTNSVVQTAHSALFQNASLLFLLFSVVSLITTHKQQPRFGTQVYLYAIIDIIAITTLTHALNSGEGSLEILLIITIIGTALLLPERGAILIASFATLALLGERGYSQLIDQLSVNYTQAGLLGATFFAVALLSTALNRRLKESEQLAEQRGIDLANLAQLNQHVIQLLQSGVLVIDKNQRIRLVNQTALQLLGLPDKSVHLNQLPATLQQHYQHWAETKQQPDSHFKTPQKGSKISAHFKLLGSQAEQGTIIFLEDSSALSQRVQHLKLASLGQLTASIAHEIRNPLGAISHAAQLLDESPALEQEDKRLIEIISNHSSRMNTIIESILQLSRREEFKPTTIVVDEWLETFLDELISSNPIDIDDIAIHINSNETIAMDPTHLYQIVSNLCNNAIHHSRHCPDTPKVELHYGTSPTHQHPYLDIEDHGPGISPADAEHIFEPFYTTENSGTGLGLYIARELCECNHATLDYIESSRGARFRITFSNLDTTQQRL
ncbi:MAG: PAS domain-containing sensor histidine kinase [Gammaproteobacteria bacterium]|nr:PAS domain-containing sensor histidine kinase [Gammaproteobacteria bacterium]MCF6230063.1 PAS domain-containing sensor histidine kinase [Gammaproteobacteria bacterium]